MTMPKTIETKCRDHNFIIFIATLGPSRNDENAAFCEQSRACTGCIGNECDLITCCLQHYHAPSLAGVRTGSRDKKSSTMLRPTCISLVSSLSFCAREVHVGKVAYWLRVEREGLRGWGKRVAMA